MMTTEELNLVVANAKAEYNNEKNRLDDKLQTTIRKAYISWAKDNARFKVGDIIAYPGTDIIIKIERITTIPGYAGPYVAYYGPRLTKKLTVNIKNNNPNFGIYDDGREIIKLK